MSRLLAYAFGTGLVAAVAAPGLRDPSDDGYPLSTYPMFARPRGKPLLNFIEGVDARGEPVRLPPELVANQEVMQAAATVRRAVQAGARGMLRLCERVAERVAVDERFHAVVEVRIVAARFDPVRYFTVSAEPESRNVRVSCSVERKQ